MARRFDTFHKFEISLTFNQDASIIESKTIIVHPLQLTNPTSMQHFHDACNANTYPTVKNNSALPPPTNLLLQPPDHTPQILLLSIRLQPPLHALPDTLHTLNNGQLRALFSIQMQQGIKQQPKNLAP